MCKKDSEIDRATDFGVGDPFIGSAVGGIMLEWGVDLGRRIRRSGPEAENLTLSWVLEPKRAQAGLKYSERRPQS